MQIEGSRAGTNLQAADVDQAQSESLDRYKEEIKFLQMEVESLKAKHTGAPDSVDSFNSVKESIHAEEKVVEIHEDKNVISQIVDPTLRVADTESAESLATQPCNASMDKPEELTQGLLASASDNIALDISESISNHYGELSSEHTGLLSKEEKLNVEALPENTASSFYFILGITT